MTALGELCCVALPFCCVVYMYIASSFFLSISVVELSCRSLGLEFDVFGGLVTPVFSFMLSLSSPVYQVEMLCLLCLDLYM